MNHSGSIEQNLLKIVASGPDLYYFILVFATYETVKSFKMIFIAGF